MSYPGASVFWIEPTTPGTIEHRLRRYAHSTGTGFTCADGYHQAAVYIGDRLAVWRVDPESGRRSLDFVPTTPHDDPRWPTHCHTCDYVFTDDDAYQDFQDLVYVNPVTHDEYVLHRVADSDGLRPAAPPGAMWNAWWMTYNLGDDGICLVVRLPNGRDWLVDSRASNCTMPDDTVHKCWVREGDPRNPSTLSVGKTGVTCAAGAGSIQADDYHGFLTNGQLTPG